MAVTMDYWSDKVGGHNFLLNSHKISYLILFLFDSVDPIKRWIHVNICLGTTLRLSAGEIFPFSCDVKMEILMGIPPVVCQRMIERKGLKGYPLTREVKEI